MTDGHLLASDLDAALERAEGDIRSLVGGRLFITGGTGFVGSWLLELFAWGARRLDVDLSVVALTRDPSVVARRMPHLAASPAISLVAGDVRSRTRPPGEFAAVILGAASSDNAWTVAHPVEAAETIEQGTHYGLALAGAGGASRVLLLSSGAVYGPQPADLHAIPEDFPGQPPAEDAYGRAKRAAETLVSNWCDSQRSAVTARIFSVYGPYQPLRTHFAIGNFIADAISGREVTVRGDGSPVRSYLYAADLAVALLACLVRGTPGAAYNVGGAEPIQLRDLAALVAAQASPPVEISVLGQSGPTVDRYVPDVRKLTADLGFAPEVALADGVRRTIAFASRWSDRAQTTGPGFGTQAER